MNDEQDDKISHPDENQSDPMAHSDQSGMADWEVDLQKAKDEASKNLDGWRRSQAEFENYQKRKEGENKELIEFAREVTIAKLLPTLDTVEQSLAHIPDDISKMDEWKNGISGTLKKLEGVLQELGVKKIVAVGQKFNPNFHEAVREVPGDEDGMVVEEYQTGYELNGKVIRPSQVTISKRKD
jgi:molecular chaperone GrpE